MIKLNGEVLLETENAFVEYRVAVPKEHISFDQPNLLEVVLSSNHHFDLENNENNKMPFKYAHSRKAAYQYSWDWAPELKTVGIWKKVHLVEY